MAFLRILVVWRWYYYVALLGYYIAQLFTTFALGVLDDFGDMHCILADFDGWLGHFYRCPP